MEHVKAITRTRLELDDDTAVLVAQVACASPGCPPLETIVTFWTAEGLRHQFKVFKPVALVTAEDLPFRWMRPTLAALEGYGCDCC